MCCTHAHKDKGLTQHDQLYDALLVTTGVSSKLADVLPLVSHPNISYLDGGNVQVYGTCCEADSALHWRFGVVGFISGVKHSDVCPFSLLWLVDPGYLRGRRYVIGCVQQE